MFTFFYNAVRMFAYALLVLTAVAAWIGRMNPPSPTLRTPRPALQVELDGEAQVLRLVRRISTEGSRDGPTRALRRPGGHQLNHASCSPWRDSEDRSQMVAQWVSFDGPGLRRVALRGRASPATRSPTARSWTWSRSNPRRPRRRAGIPGRRPGSSTRPATAGCITTTSTSPATAPGRTARTGLGRWPGRTDLPGSKGSSSSTRPGRPIRDCGGGSSWR